MRSFFALFVLCVGVMSFGCVEVDPPPPPPPPAPVVNFVNCDAPIGGIALDAGAESTPGYDDELAALDLTALPAVISLEDFSTLDTALVAYALDVDRALLHPLNRDELLTTPMGRAVLAAFATDRAKDTGDFDFAFFRRGFHRFHACSRGLPATIDDLYRLFETDGAPDDALVISDTFPKRPLRRRVWSPPAYPEMFIAETLSEDDSVRETEIVWRGERQDGLLDFAAYAPDGVISGASHFATASGFIAASSPYTCLFCHADDGFRFNVVAPDM